MATVTRFFFRTPYDVAELTPWTVVEWWEARRLPYNLAVGAAGLVSLGAIGLLSWITGGSFFLLPWEPIVGYAVAANVCYTWGPLADLYVVRRWGAQYAPVGPTLFRYGFVFSVGLTLLPLPLIMVGAILDLLSRL